MPLNIHTAKPILNKSIFSFFKLLLFFLCFKHLFYGKRYTIIQFILQQPDYEMNKNLSYIKRRRGTFSF